VKVPAPRELGRVLRPRPIPIALAALAAVGIAVLLIARDGDDSSASSPADGRNGDLFTALTGIDRPHIELTPQPEKASGPRFVIAQVRPGERIEIRDAPGGRVIAEAGDRTEFGSIRNLWVKRVSGDWFGVPAPELGNGRLGWIRDDRIELELFETHYWIVADTSAHLLELHKGNRVLNRFPVTVGSPGSPTPLGDYSVTDGLAGRGVGPYYGCCILALSGHQPNLPANWLGGDRIAIHGTPFAVGGANSAGCLRTTDRDMVQLFARVPLGAPVFIRA
jgi:hypothetical protein